MKKKIPKESTLSPLLTGTVVDAKTVARVQGAPKSRRTRDVVFHDGTSKRINTQVLQDDLLIAKGYLPKYSGKDAEYFQKRNKLKTK